MFLDVNFLTSLKLVIVKDIKRHWQEKHRSMRNKRKQIKWFFKTTGSFDRTNSM